MSFKRVVTRILPFAFIGLLSVAVLAQVKESDSSWIAPTRASQRTNPLLNPSDFAAGGEKLFRSRCASCHEERGNGTSRGPQLTKAEVQTQPDGALFWKITTGNAHGGMPAFSFLPATQRWQLVLHLRALAGR